MPPSTDCIVNGAELFTGTFSPGITIPTGLKQLNQALGGGYRKGETTMYASANGDGKSVMAVQTVGQMIRDGHKVLMVSTEETDRQFTMRLLSNRCQVDYGVLLDYQNPNAEIPGAELPIVPPFLMANAQTAALAHQLIDDARKHLTLADWTNDTHSLTGELEQIILSVEQTGFRPDVVIFDWVGGAILQDRNADSRRLILEEAVNAFTSICRRRNIVGIVFAQLDKKQSTNKSWVTMSMLSESKTMTNRIHNFIGITGLRPKDKDQGGVDPAKLPRQYFCVDKCRNGPGGRFAVNRNFKYMRFTESPTLLIGI